MDTAMPRERLEEVFDQIIREVTKQAAGICLCQGDILPSGELCTVYTVFERGFDTSVSFCAESSLFVRLTQYMMQERQITAQDVEDFSKEFFNMLCGHISSRMFQMTKVASRFEIPVFYRGRYVPEGHEEHFAISYISDENENAQFIHHTPRKAAGKLDIGI